MKIVDLTDIFALHHIKEFNDIYLSPVKFKDTDIHYLQKRVSFENKIIAVCSMTNLPLEEYINILNSYFILYRKNEINEKLLNRSIFSEFDTSSRLIRQYKNPLVRNLLFKILNCKTISKEFKVNLKETLDGKIYRDLKRTGQLE